MKEQWEVIPVRDTEIVKQGVEHPAIGIWDRSTSTEIAFVRKGEENRAQLISASPDLLAALVGILKWIDCDCNPSRISVENARAAVAKARGEKL